MTDKQQKDGCCGGGCACNHDHQTPTDSDTDVQSKKHHESGCCGGGHHEGDNTDEAPDLSAKDIATINRILGDIDDDLEEDKDLSPEEVATLKKIFKMTEHDE